MDAEKHPELSVLLLLLLLLLLSLLLLLFLDLYSPFGPPRRYSRKQRLYADNRELWFAMKAEKHLANGQQACYLSRESTRALTQVGP